ncbi:MAG TPA: type II CRISPR RNA-guided endonuclease Cas9 [Bacteroidales bacterium]|nr:type II CRISPR RNA-guided endonuclease Cas9 [Bacteroidales bacterium]HPB25641.1 type II CRISPR RNA-guided endonuclease Cas9 [Bacteroidales bacterium]HPI29631.1 type II CRISPR RNA-guided endonuclease Cas9 [Bacteroidales bacterium]HQN16010.1 type II CRISPR RNA-guided endonuclease Cas9 [Bacteroidales bacterium]HQP15312.1 type II CRISPR RNA-guided endonuclease Cas9 [Bacteroidales bacterium]
MKKILGLDLGTNSIGWALIEIDIDGIPIRIIAMGSRIIPLTSEDRDQFTKGQAISKNQERTTARSQRKGYDRKQLRKDYDFKYSLIKVMKNYGLIPNEELFNLPMLDLWKLRSMAASEPISPEQLGRILYMMNQKRGYKSARSEANQDKKDTDYIADIKGRYAQLKEKEQTIGQHFYSELKCANQNNTYYRIKEKVYPREAYIDEFDTIINVQKDAHSFLTDEVINNLRNEIIYYQRKLKSQKGLVNICEFEGFNVVYPDPKTQQEKSKFVGPKVAPKTSPLFQLCKIWEVVNNISLKIKNPEGAKYKWSDKIPTLEEKQQIANYLFHHSNLSSSELLNILNLKKENVYLNKQILKGIQGNNTFSEIHALIGDSEHLSFNFSIVPSRHEALLVDKKTGEIIEEKDALQIDPSIEKEPLYQLWHTIYSIKDLEECKKALIKCFAFDETTADKLSRIDFNKQSFGNKSNKAMRKILPYLMQGYNYSDACSFAGYNHSNSLTKDEQAKLETENILKLLPKNSLRQPIVEKIINQMINVVNALIIEFSEKDEKGEIRKYWKPDEIRIELARELKQSKEERNDSTVNNTANEVINKEIENRLKELGVKTTKRFIEKYKLIFPIRTVIDGKTGKALPKKLKDAIVTNRCIYCGKTFSLAEALTGDNFDVDHIIPKDLLPIDNSLTNKVLVHRNCNATKTNYTAYDYIAKQGETVLRQYVERVDEWYKQGIISYGKMLRLKVSYEEYIERKKNHKETEADKRLWEDFLSRDLKATQYIARKSTEILKQVCNNVTMTEGSVTATLRRLWGWDDVLMNLQLPKYKELEEKIGQKFTQIKEWESDHGKRKHQKEEIIGWTKRDDHRHHAIDALVIACTKQGFIQRINTLNASETKDAMQKEMDVAKSKLGKAYDENILKATNEIVKNHSGRLSRLDEYLINQKPFNTADVMKEADKILVSFKAGKKVVTISKYKAKGKNEQTGVITPRGALHEQSVYGKIKVIEKRKSIKYIFENPDKIVNKKIQCLVMERLANFKNEVKMAIESLKKNPIYLDEQNKKTLETAACFKDEIVIKYPVTSIKAKDVPFIVDKKIRKIVQSRLDEFNGKETEAFKDILWLNKEKQIPIRTVRCFTGLSAVQPIKKDKNGRGIGYALTKNNHHIAIYEDIEGKLIEHSCTFWNAVERKKYKIPYVIKDTPEMWNSIIDKDLPESFLNKLPPDNLKLRFSMQQNEMFILGMTNEDFAIAISEKNKSVLSNHFYLVWSIAEGDYWFRHHLETKNSELKKISGAKEGKRYYRLSSKGLLELNPIKVRLNHLGEITKIGE